MPIMGLGAAPPGSNWHQEIDELFRFDDPRTRTETKVPEPKSIVNYFTHALFAPALHSLPQQR